MIEKYKDLIHMIDARRAVPPILEPKVVEAYLAVFGRTEDFKGYVACRCTSYIKLFYSSLKIKLNDYERKKYE